MNTTVQNFILKIKRQARNYRDKNLFRETITLDNYYENATLYYKTKLKSLDCQFSFIDEMPIGMLYHYKLSTWKTKDIDVIFPMYFCNDDNPELLCNEVKSATAVFNNFEVNYCKRRPVICNGIKYDGHRHCLYDVTHKKLLFLVTMSSLINLPERFTLNFYFDESIFRENTLINKFLRNVYAAFYESTAYLALDSYNAVYNPQICMGIPNVGYKDSWKEIGDGTRKGQEREIQSRIDKFIKHYGS